MNYLLMTENMIRSKKISVIPINKISETPTSRIGKIFSIEAINDDQETQRF